MYGVSVSVIPGGDNGTRATVARMRQLVRSGALDPLVRSTAVRIVAGVPGLDTPLQARLIRDWVDARTSYLADPRGAELLHEPAALIRHILTEGLARVDCDDVAILSAALGSSIGLPARFQVVAFQTPDAPYRHVWTELGSRAGWLPVDPTRPAQALNGLTISRMMTVEV